MIVRVAHNVRQHLKLPTVNWDTQGPTTRDIDLKVSKCEEATLAQLLLAMGVYQFSSISILSTSGLKKANEPERGLHQELWLPLYMLHA